MFAPFYFLLSVVRASQTPCDQKLHDFIGAGVDTHHARVAIHPRDRKFLHIAVTAKKLQATIDDLSLQVGDPVLSHGGRDRIERAAKIALDAMVVERSEEH